jgi:KDEL-tailed cysteine endopeptidase
MASNSLIFGSYSTGIINEKACGDELDHSVLIVGYGDDSIYGPFWIAKNCWGTLWGEKGFFKIKRDLVPGGNGTCGIQMNSLIPTL